MRASWTVAIVVAGIALIFASRLSAFAADEADPPRVTLLGSLAEWMYPDATMPHGATMSDGLYLTNPGVSCSAVLETSDDFNKVVAYYDKQLGPKSGDARKPDGAAAAGPVQSVIVLDDPSSRATRVRVLMITRPGLTTTLVISQGAKDDVTHIAWVQRHSTPTPK
jgi:hypothetical protein